jgi:preprotein translocase subunit SecE
MASGGTGVAEDRNTEREDGQQRPPRPVTAAARRERRAGARPAARRDASQPAADAATKSQPRGKTDKDTKDKVASKAVEAKGRPTPTRDAKVARPSMFSRLMRFLREVVAELRKVIWPTRKQMITYTAVVLVFLAVMTALIAGMDLVLAKGVLYLFG